MKKARLLSLALIAVGPVAVEGQGEASKLVIKAERLLIENVTMLPASEGFADLEVVLIEESEISLPYALSPSNYANSPSNYANSPSNYANSESNYANSPSNYANSPSNYANGPSGTNRLMSENEYVGYYVWNGAMNFYNAEGKRVAFNPNLDDTQSLFHSTQSAWCGTFADIGGRRVIGLVPSCYYRFFY